MSKPCCNNCFGGYKGGIINRGYVTDGNNNICHNPSCSCHQEASDWEDITDKYRKFAGMWHDIDCQFPEVDSAVCNCDTIKNGKVFSDFLASQRTALLDELEKEIEKMIKSPSVLGYKFEREKIGDIKVLTPSDEGNNDAVNTVLSLISSKRKQQ